MRKLIMSMLMTVLLTSCATSDVMSFTTQEGPRLFIRPVTMKGEYEVKTDMNIPCTDFTISGDATVNYSVFFPSGSEPHIRSAVLAFVLDGETFTVLDSEMMFIESAGGKRQEARFTSVLDEETMKTVCENAGDVSACLIIGDRIMDLNSSKLSKALQELNLNLL
ncbi:MAG: hypothetical protein ACI4NM_08830 [Bullifex sp.]